MLILIITLIKRIRKIMETAIFNIAIKEKKKIILQIKNLGTSLRI